MKSVFAFVLGAVVLAASVHVYSQTSEEAATAETRPAPADGSASSTASASEPAAPAGSPPETVAAAEPQTEAEKAIAELSTDNLTDDTRKRLTKGYAAVVKDDVPFYCRKEMPIGSRLAKRQCYTMEQLVDMERIRIITQQKMERKQVQNPTRGF